MPNVVMRVIIREGRRVRVRRCDHRSKGWSGKGPKTKECVRAASRPRKGKEQILR